MTSRLKPYHSVRHQDCPSITEDKNIALNCPLPRIAVSGVGSLRRAVIIDDQLRGPDAGSAFVPFWGQPGFERRPDNLRGWFVAWDGCSFLHGTSREQSRCRCTDKKKERRGFHGSFYAASGAAILTINSVKTVRASNPLVTRATLASRQAPSAERNSERL